MKKQEYLIILKNRETLETIDSLYTYANDMNHAQKIANMLMFKYDNPNIEISIIKCYNIEKEEKWGTNHENENKTNYTLSKCHITNRLWQ